jgi:hypothetical protein
VWQVKREKQQMLDWAESERRKVEKWAEEQRQAIAKEKKGTSLLIIRHRGLGRQETLLTIACVRPCAVAARQNARAAQLEELKQLAPTRQEKAEIEALKATIEKVEQTGMSIC